MTATSIEIKLNKSDPNINMQFDQDQLMQITQLINNLNSQQQQQLQQQTGNGQQLQVNHDVTNPSEFQFQFQNLIDNETILLNNQQIQSNFNQGICLVFYLEKTSLGFRFLRGIIFYFHSFFLLYGIIF